MAKKATKTVTRLSIDVNTNGKGHSVPRVFYSGFAKTFVILATVGGKVHVLKHVVDDKTKAYQLRNRIAGEGTIDPSLWTSLEPVEDTFEVQQ